MDSTTIRVDSDFKGTREFQKSTSVLFKSMSRNKKWELKCSRFLFRIRDFMLNKKDILGWNISIKLMHIQSMLN